MHKLIHSLAMSTEPGQFILARRTLEHLSRQHTILYKHSPVFNNHESAELISPTPIEERCLRCVFPNRLWVTRI